MEILMNYTDAMIAVAYLFLFTGYLRNLLTGRAPRGGLFLAFLPSAVALHCVKLIIQGVSEGHCPLVGIHEMLSFTSFSIAVIYLTLERSQKYYTTGALFLGIVFILQASSVLMVVFAAPLPPNLTGVPIGLHAPLALIAFASFATSAVCGGIYLIMYRLLKEKRLSANLREVPSLESIERMQTLSSRIGVALMASAIASGLTLGLVYGHGFGISDPKVIASVAVLLIFAYGVFGDLCFSFSGRKKAVIAIAGVAAAFITTAVVRLILPTFHRF